MGKKIRVLLLSVVLVFFVGNNVFAETELVAEGYYATVRVTAPPGKYIGSVKLKSDKGILVVIGTSLGWLGGRSKGIENGLSYAEFEYKIMCGDPVTSYTYMTFENRISNSKVWITNVTYCDGTSESFYDPYPPPPPDPPDEGGSGGANNPPAGGNLPPTKDWGAVDNSKPANACGGGRWENPIRNWVDNIFCPVITFLDLARAKLAAASLMMGQGLNIGKYFKIFGDLPSTWQLVVSSLLLMVATLGALLIFRSAMRIYYSIKEGVKWW